MERTAKLVLAKNALANIVRGSAAALTAVLLPPFLTRLMSSDAFGAWCLVLQLSAYVGYLDFGIQTAVGRFVAHTNEQGDTDYRDRIVNTSLAVLSGVCVLTVVGAAIFAAALPRLFRQVPGLFVSDIRMALVLVASSLAIGLPASIFNGIFIGLQRNEVPAAIIGGSRILSAALLVLVVKHGGDLTQMGVTVALVNILSYFIQYVMYRRLSPDIRLSPRLVSRRAARELFDYCWSLMIWSFAMLLVTGLDVTLVGYFQFKSVGYYAVAASLVTFIAGVQNAVFNAMISPLAVLHARGASEELGRIMVTATRYGTLLLLLTGLPIIIFAKSVLTLWVGPSYAANGVLLLRILVMANILRLSATPYVVTLIGAGQQRLVTVTPLLEGFSNLFVSFAAGYVLGALGVALGTLFGSIVGVAGNFLYNMKRTTSLRFRTSDYIWNGLLRPCVCAVPSVVFAVVIRFYPEPAPLIAPLAVLALVMTLACLWFYGLSGMERDKLKSGEVFASVVRGLNARW